MTVRTQLRWKLFERLCWVAVWNGLFLVMSYLVPAWIGWPLFLYVLINVPAGVWMSVQHYRKLVGSPFLYLAEIQRLTGDL